MAKKRRRGGFNPALAILVALALVGAGFGLGWHFGVQSMRYKGDILLVNEQNQLPATYVPEGLEPVPEPALLPAGLQRHLPDPGDLRGRGADVPRRRGGERQRLHHHQRLSQLRAPEGDFCHH